MKLPQASISDSWVTGVTGHRHLDEVDKSALELAVDECLADIEATFPSKNHCLVSGLAAGADQLVAWRALTRGWALKAVLAAPLDTFALTMPFIDAHSLRNELIPKCSEVTVVASSEQGEKSGYIAVANSILNAGSLIALWDGEPGRGAGGTADTVVRFLEESDRHVYWVHTRRFGDTQSPNNPGWKKINMKNWRAKVIL